MICPKDLKPCCDDICHAAGCLLLPGVPMLTNWGARSVECFICGHDLGPERGAVSGGAEYPTPLINHLYYNHFLLVTKLIDGREKHQCWCGQVFHPWDAEDTREVGDFMVHVGQHLATHVDLKSYWLRLA